MVVYLSEEEGVDAGSTRVDDQRKADDCANNKS